MIIDFIFFFLLKLANYIIKSLCVVVCVREVGSRSFAAAGCVCASLWEGLV